MALIISKLFVEVEQDLQSEHFLIEQRTLNRNSLQIQYRLCPRIQHYNEYFQTKIDLDEIYLGFQP